MQVECVQRGVERSEHCLACIRRDILAAHCTVKSQFYELPRSAHFDSLNRDFMLNRDFLM